ncbi:MAG: M20 family metallopeptidase [Planctomycetota bacterium]|nr:M20 family metallopeptidase [Planctomycetota bacterium]
MTADVVSLTQQLVSIPSVSGAEHGCVALLAKLLPSAVVSGRNVYAVRGDGANTLLLNSHTDTVPASAEWTNEPHAAQRRDGKIFGLGANDAKGPLAALVVAFLRARVPASGRLVLAATCDEETGGDGLGVLRPELPTLSAAIIGEPTTCTVCSCQRGLLRLRLHARGRRAHAARPWQGENAIEKAARDVSRLAALDLPEHPLLGPATLQVTMIDGGVKTNVVPPECVMEIDARTIPALDNAAAAARVRDLVESDVELVSDRFVPLETPSDAAIVRAALAASGTEHAHAFGGVSDFFHVRDVPAIVMGPGRSEQSHAADEWVEVEQLERAVAVYGATIERYFDEPG